MESTAVRDDVTAQLHSMLQAVEAIASRLGEVGEMMRTPKLSFEQQRTLLQSLPLLTESQLKELDQHDASCPICLTSYLAILAESEMAEAMDSPAHPIEELGVTRLSQPWQCGHMFCRRDITKWINSGNDSCPLCRRLLVDPSTLPTPTPAPAPPTSAADSNPTSTTPSSDTNPTAPTPNANTNPTRTPLFETSNTADQDSDEEDTLDNLLRQAHGGDGRFVLGGMGFASLFGPSANNRNRGNGRDDDEIDRGYSGMYS
ncbi:hypothetical protein CVT24_001771 [Panaeolus cyanescens]|uniref:RING-type domain-containing protein n=1 Tax=Panaeolus cyanescens TaxID=181874 RepID=A0A409YUC0_9AGAR|nr:hypothetical protein CVT24_001771 [Panaeolus cyanescens]